MWQTLREHPRILGTVAGIHLLLLAVMLLGFEFTPRSQASVMEISVADAEPIQVIEAVAVDARSFDRIEEQKREAERQRVEAERQRRLEEERRRAEAERQRQEEARRQEQARQEAERRRQAEAEAERRRQEEARRQAEAERQRQEEQRRQEEARRQAEEEARRQAEAERQRRLEEERRAEEARRQAALAAEERRLQEAAAQRAREEEARRQAARQAQLDSQRQQYMAAIRSAVERAWLRPADHQSGQRAVVFVRQAPGGFIQEVRIESCTGNPAFCRSVEAAVRRAEPLPSPPDPELFAREIRFTFEPS
ncbi:cell envelope integrity protein TolA [Thioalkalivibrio sulfidiphilus]|uniref:cell envelope integrity protein TolA n=1 Tax=Thioalkalivibrio sulfidiphilus TaxID=1033854 RepID=UPI0003729386|nr:cell envelope integrity protein TolA [Thioalkalivibrio sulfidiphilus]